MMNEEVYSIKEVAQVLKVSRDTVRRMIASGHLQAFKVQTQWRVCREVLDRLMKKP